jgi:hypothetical protein
MVRVAANVGAIGGNVWDGKQFHQFADDWRLMG